MKILALLDAALNKAEGALLVLMLSVMILLSFLQVILRNLLGEGIVWADVLLRHLVLWVGFLGASLAVSHQRHIGIDALTRVLSGRWQLAVRVVTNLFAAGACFLLFDASRAFLNYEIEDGRILFLGIPEWYSELIIPVGFALLMVHFLVRVAVTTKDTIRGTAV
jgi:TRAP-type C4-dicarboxylate transport system permease small subunit